MTMMIMIVMVMTMTVIIISIIIIYPPTPEATDPELGVCSLPHLKCCSLKETATSSFHIIGHSQSSSHLTPSCIAEEAPHVHRVTDYGVL
jgi:hypothetical protein